LRHSFFLSFVFRPSLRSSFFPYTTLFRSRFVAALVSAPGTVAQARATASGLVSGGQAASPEVIVWVQVRRAWPMETRAAIGKVWVDANNDGVQRSGEAGLAGIDIWTEDGLVATTDSTGTFSFTHLRPGRHAFRLDPPRC